MKERTVRSFAEEYRTSEEAARPYLNALVESGRVTAVKKALRIGFNGKEVMTRRTVIT